MLDAIHYGDLRFSQGLIVDDPGPCVGNLRSQGALLKTVVPAGVTSIHVQLALPEADDPRCGLH